MALNDQAVLTPARGFVYLAPVGTAAPSPADVAKFSPDTALAGWESVGHTARDELPTWGYDGGEVETRGSWQSASLREVVTAAATDYVQFRLHQFDKGSLGLYYSVSDPGDTPGVFAVKQSPTKPLERALLIVIMDGDVSIAFYAPRASVRRDESIELSIDEFAALPVRATFLTQPGVSLFEWISEATGVNPAPPAT
ncbi:hypothetical protein GCM10012275_39230 [Longimycelium tulufanense]|uniref:Phage tail protein n=1 Tax=Longimycelium tulufanense TaxID=907463 RepID=A0A8J3FWA7_9PSEU|nr:phage tail protein [Longimycelium tulufanense]GGM64797.1 hypothetical protein GCM10012275_39230 [Longimycelium tulufanense]